MGSNIFSASLSGMNAAQYGLSTAQNNIANANTPGYTRQTVLLTSQAAQATGAGFVGQGVNVTGVVRAYDQFLTGQVRQVQSQASYLTTYLSSMTQVDNLLSNTTSGISTSLQGFYNAMNGLVNNPESIPARQTVLGTAQSAVNSFKTMDQSLTDIASGLSGQISGSVQTVNTYATQIATLNISIKSAIAASQGQQPNALLDQRDQLVNLLNKEVKVNVQQQTDGSMSVFMGSGQALVVGDKAMALQVVQNPSDPSKVDVAYLNLGKITTIQQSSLQGGNLGAYLTFRDQSLEPARNALGLVALGMAANINQQNQMGQDLNGARGGSLMLAAAPRVSSGANNAGTALMTGAIYNVGAMTTSDYQLKYDGTNYSMTRLSDNVVTNLGATLPGAGVDGFSVTLSAGTPVAGDTYLIRPTANAARDIALTTSDPAKIATALPLRASASISASSAIATSTVISGAITDSAVTVAGTTATSATFTVDGKALLTSSVAAGAAVPSPLTTAAGLDLAWPAFAAANPGYILSGTFAGGNAQITKAGGTAITLAETITAGTGATTTPLSAATVGFMGTTPGSAANKTTVASGLISGSVISVAGTTASAAAFTVDGKTLFSNSIAAGATGTLITGANLDAAWPAFAAANPGYTLSGTFVAGTAQITLQGGTPITLAETQTAGTGATLSPFAAAGAGFIGTSPGTAASKVAGITVATPANANLTSPVSIAFSSPTSYTVTGAVPAVVGAQVYNPLLVPLPTISYNGWTMQLSAAPAAGDVLNVVANSGAATVGSGAYNLNPVSINFTSATTYDVVEMRGVPPAAVTLGTGVPYVSGTPISYNGWTAQITGVPAIGDTFNISKGTNAGTMLVTAAAANTAGAAISGGALSVQPFTIMFNNPATSYTVSGATPAVVGSVPYVAGQDISYNGWTMQVTGAPVAGDVFNVATNTNATGDNRNALLMAGQQNQNMMINGTTTILGTFSQMVGSIGAKTQELTITSQAQDAMLTQTVATQQSVSGVNLDEEAANLLRYQRAYQAAAKAMQIANTMFDSLLTLGR